MTILDKTSMIYWWPLVSRLNIPMPRTSIIEVDPDEMMGMLDGKKLSDETIKRLQPPTEIPYPLFMRTDYVSGKHSYDRCCFVKAPANLLSHIYSLVEAQYMPMGIPDIGAIIFRELLPIDPAFIIPIWNNLPIVAERRFFVDGGKILCKHAYWPEDAIAQGDELKDIGAGWKDKLRAVNTFKKDEDILDLYAREISLAVEGCWSVDFMLTKQGWYFIDMAEGEKSWHPECHIDIPAQAV